MPSVEEHVTLYTEGRKSLVTLALSTPEWTGPLVILVVLDITLFVSASSRTALEPVSSWTVWVVFCCRRGKVDVLSGRPQCIGVTQCCRCTSSVMIVSSVSAVRFGDTSPATKHRPRGESLLLPKSINGISTQAISSSSAVNENAHIAFSAINIYLCITLTAT